MNPLIIVAVAAACLCIGYVLRLAYGRIDAKSCERNAKKILEEAREQSEKVKKEGIAEIREKMLKEHQEFERETRERKNQMSGLEKRIMTREENMERRFDLLEKKERDTAFREREISQKHQKLDEKIKEHSNAVAQQVKILEQLSGMSREEAKNTLINTMQEDARAEAAIRLKKIEEELQTEADKKAKSIISLAISRVASDAVQESSVTRVEIANDDIKGRVIGREGRNIKAFEQATGVDLIVDDTPEIITISSYDGVRREIARVALERLIADGRIQPTRIDEVVKKVASEMDQHLLDMGQDAVLSLGLKLLPKEILSTLGRLKYRTSYGQNVLAHSVEVAKIAGYIAQEIEADSYFCKYAGLLHDLGKAIDRDVEGTHPELGVEMIRKFDQNPKLANAILAHHEGKSKPESVEAVLIMAADAISAARPGARKESLDAYMKRIGNMEKLVSSFKGVDKCYAIQAGREVRVIVSPDEVDDGKAELLAREIAKKVESELEYPGQVKVTVIREKRFQEIAK